MMFYIRLVSGEKQRPATISHQIKEAIERRHNAHDKFSFLRSCDTPDHLIPSSLSAYHHGLSP